MNIDLSKINIGVSGIINMPTVAMPPPPPPPEYEDPLLDKVDKKLKKSAQKTGEVKKSKAPV